MKILIAHNTYQNPGGEDVVVEHESRMLEEAGHTVVRLERSNLEINQYPLWKKALLPLTSIWSRSSHRHMRELLELHQPDVVHVHNIHFLLSPSIVHASKQAGVPTVCTLHNWRRLCPGANLYHDGEECTRSLRCVLRGSYRGSRAASATVMARNSLHEMLGTWDGVQHIVMSEFARRKFVAAGVSAVHVKPHFLTPDPGFSREHGGYAVFAGALSEEKGAAVLMTAWSMLGRHVPLIIAGNGPYRERMRAWAEAHGRRLGMQPPVGHMKREELMRLVHNATTVIVPSQSPEPFGMITIEALASGVPVIASDAGALPEIVKDGVNGLIFHRKDPAELAARVETLWGDPALRNRLSEGARDSYLDRYTAERNYPQLMKVYEAAGLEAAVRKPMLAAV